MSSKMRICGLITMTDSYKGDYELRITRRLIVFPFFFKKKKIIKKSFT